MEDLLVLDIVTRFLIAMLFPLFDVTGEFCNTITLDLTSRVCTDFLQLQNINLLPWPALSADMSPFEHLWDMLGRRVSQRRQQPCTLNELRQALAFEWQHLPQRLVRQLVGSTRRQCQTLIESCY